VSKRIAASESFEVRLVCLHLSGGFIEPISQADPLLRETSKPAHVVCEETLTSSTRTPL
jgi:hypothetical protein